MKKKILTGIAVGLSVLTVSTPVFAATVKTNTGTRKVSDTTYNAAKDAFEKASPQKTEAKKVLDNAKKEQTAAQNNVNKVNNQIIAKNKEIADLKKELSTTRTQYNSAKAAAEKRKNWVNNVTDKIKNDAEYKALQTAENNLKNAQSKVAAKNKDIASAKNMVTNKEKAYKDKQAKQKEGSFAFFQWVADNYPAQASDARTALDILKNNKYSNMIKKGESYDATSLANMKKAIGFIRTSNKLRVGDEYMAASWSNAGIRKKDANNKLYALSIDHRCMAQSQVNAAYSSKTIGHSDASGMGENLAWGAGNMFNGLYYREKEVYKNWLKDKNETGETGHYINMIFAEYKATGAACKTDDSLYGYVYSQTYSYYTESGLSVDEYEKLFDKYCNWVNPENAKKELDSAKSALTARQNELKNLQNEETTAKNARAKAKAAVDDLKDSSKLATAEKKVMDLNKKITDINSKIKTKETELKTLQSKLAEAQKGLDNAKKKVADKQKIYDEISKTVPSLESALLKRITDKKYTYLNKYVDNMLASKVGWKYENGGWRYYSEKNGKAYTGWHWMDKAEGENTGHWSYFGKDGKIYTGWRNMGKNEGEKTAHWSYFGPNGWLRTGWQQMGKGTNNPDGNAAKHWSYFGGNGWLRTGWQWMDQSQGEKIPHWSYFGGNGWLRTGMVTLGKADGEKITHKSYFGSNGWLVTNKKFSVAGKTYTADGRGWVK